MSQPSTVSAPIPSPEKNHGSDWASSSAHTPAPATAAWEKPPRKTGGGKSFPSDAQWISMGTKGHPFLLVGSATLLETPPPNWSEWSPHPGRSLKSGRPAKVWLSLKGNPSHKKKAQRCSFWCSQHLRSLAEPGGALVEP